jgi:hypothetical protein
VSLESVLGRISELNTAFVPPSSPATSSTATSGTDFAASLQGAMTGAPAAGASAVTPMPMGSGVGARIVAAAAGEIGQTEQPPGSNNSPRIAQYRTATEGNPGPGPWCAYFVSWAARQAGAPVGDHGQGFGSVDALYAWAQSAGRAYTASSGRTPQPGDLIVFNEHIGIVESVDASGQIHTIEGNTSNSVLRRVHAPSEAVGFVRMS